MAIWYCDYANPSSNDANDGKSWATAFKTLNAVTAAKGFVSGDMIHFAKSPDPTSLGQTAQWTDMSKTVTLTTPVTRNIDLCDVAWTKAAATSANTQVGVRSPYNITIAIGAGVTANTLMAYHATGSLDLSAFQQVSLWYFVNVATTASTNWTLCLCSDTVGQTILYSVPLPVMPAGSTWTPIAVDVGTPLVGTIQSVALYSGSTPQSSVNISLDNILACKAPSAPDAVTLLSLLSKNNGSDAWFPIQSINDTAIVLDNYVTLSQASTRPYVGTTENVTTFKREATRTALQSSSTATVQNIAVPGSSTVTLSGGWNPTTGLQDSETFFDGQNSLGYGFGFTVIYNVYYVENISMTRYYNGFYIGSNSLYPGSTFKMYQLAGNGNAGFYQPSSTGNMSCVVTVSNVVGNNTGINAFNNSTFTIINANSNTTAISGPLSGNTYVISTCRANQYGVFPTGGGVGALIKDSLIMNNSNTDVLTQSAMGTAPLLLKNVISGTVTAASSPSNARIISHNDQRVAGATKIWGYQYTIVNDSTTVHTAGGVSWKMAISPIPSSYPCWLLIGRVWCPANQIRTFSAWFMRNNATYPTGALVVRGNLVNGIPNNVMTTTSASVNTWEQLSINVTPAEDAVIEIEAWAWSAGGNYSVWVADFSAS